MLLERQYTSVSTKNDLTAGHLQITLSSRTSMITYILLTELYLSSSREDPRNSRTNYKSETASKKLISVKGTMLCATSLHVLHTKNYLDKKKEFVTVEATDESSTVPFSCLYMRRRRKKKQNKTKKSTLLPL